MPGNYNSLLKYGNNVSPITGSELTPYSLDFSNLGLPDGYSLSPMNTGSFPSLDSLNLKMPDVNTPGPSMFDSWFGKDGKAGYANTAMNIVGGLGNLYLGYQGLQNSREALKMQKEQWAFNKAGQTKAHNMQVEQQYRNGLLANPNNTYGYESVADYMKKYGI